MGNLTVSGKRLIRLLMIVIAALAIALSIACCVAIAHFFTPVHFWDQWEMVKHVSEGGGFSLAYLFAPHNEHVIATSKFLFYIDFLLFDYANRSLVFSIVIIHFLVAYLLCSLLAGRRVCLEKVMWFGIFGAMMLSLVQWENLTIGFQTQFGLTGLFAILSCIYAARYMCGRALDVKAFAGVAICTFLTVFSMGNGVAIAGSFAAIAVLVRSPRLANIFVIFAVYAICLVFFAYLRNSGGASTHVDLHQLPALIEFFCTVLGGAVTGDPQKAFYIGILILFAFFAISIVAALGPRLRGLEVDKSIITLLGVAVFMLGSAAAVTVGRLPWGVGAALTSRYTTPTIMLYCSLIAIAYRYVTLRVEGEGRRLRFSAMFGLLGLLVACGLIFRPGAFEQLKVRSETLTSAGYFVLSGVRTDNVLAQLYPDARAIREQVEYLRKNRLNIFSPRFGLAVLGHSRIERVGDLASCAGLRMSSPARIEDNSWQLSGSIAENHSGAKPDWLIATDADGEVLGFVPPTGEGDKESTRFSVPIHASTGDFDRRIYLVAEWTGVASCRNEQIITLPERSLSKAAPAGMRQAVYHEQLSPSGGMDEIPAVALDAERMSTPIRSTWQGNDAATGRIRFVLDDNTACDDIYVGVMRGPGSGNIFVELGKGSNVDETISLDSISPHQWWWLQVRKAGDCDGASPAFVDLVDEGRAWGSWGGITAPVAVSDGGVR